MRIIKHNRYLGQPLMPLALLIVGLLLIATVVGCGGTIGNGAEPAGSASIDAEETVGSTTGDEPPSEPSASTTPYSRDDFVQPPQVPFGENPFGETGMEVAAFADATRHLPFEPFAIPAGINAPARVFVQPENAETRLAGALAAFFDTADYGAFSLVQEPAQVEAEALAAEVAGFEDSCKSVPELCEFVSWFTVELADGTLAEIKAVKDGRGGFERGAIVWINHGFLFSLDLSPDEPFDVQLATDLASKFDEALPQIPA